VREDTSTKLHHAIKRGDALAVAHYLESGGDANLRGDSGSTLLMFAAQEGHRPIIDLLLAAGADIEATSDHLWGAVAFAAIAGHRSVVEHLLDRGARLPATAPSQLIGLLSHYGEKRQAIVDLLQAREFGSAAPKV
jgi:uncharacterized protein